MHVTAPTAGIRATTVLQEAGNLARVLTEGRGSDLRPIVEQTAAVKQRMREYAAEAISRAGVHMSKTRTFEDLPSVSFQRV